MVTKSKLTPTPDAGANRKDNSARGSRKYYVPPRLERYGNLRAITTAVGPMGADDGGLGGSPMKTSL